MVLSSTLLGFCFFFSRILMRKIIFSFLFRWVFNQSLFDLSETLLTSIKVIPMNREFQVEIFDNMILCYSRLKFNGWYFLFPLIGIQSIPVWPTWDPSNLKKKKYAPMNTEFKEEQFDPLFFWVKFWWE